jgi:hypothetical protein
MVLFKRGALPDSLNIARRKHGLFCTGRVTAWNDQITVENLTGHGRTLLPRKESSYCLDIMYACTLKLDLTQGVPSHLTVDSNPLTSHSKPTSVSPRPVEFYNFGTNLEHISVCLTGFLGTVLFTILSRTVAAPPARIGEYLWVAVSLAAIAA